MDMEAGKATSAQAWRLTVTRVVGLVFLAHGAQKLFLMGIGGVTGFFGQLGIPAAGFFAVVVILVEVFGGLALILGVLTRVAAVLLAGDMLVATLTVHLANGFFVENGGFEFTPVLLAASVMLTVAGPGAAVFGRLLAGRISNPGLARLMS